MMGGAFASIAGALLGFVAITSPALTGFLLPLACFGAATGVVVVMLATFALLPLSVAAPSLLPRANARIELSRALATMAAPALGAWLVARGRGDLAFAIAGLAGLSALIACGGLPNDMPGAGPTAPPLAAMREGAVLLATHPTLRALALCAVFWNMGFHALTALFTPYAIHHLGLGAEGVGRAWTAFGAGCVAGALLAPSIAARAPLGALLLFGPFVSVAAAAIVALAGPATPAPALWLAFSLLGFGPILWSVMQTSLRQTVTPAHLLGRVGAAMQVATYGARPFGAVMAAGAGAAFGVTTAAALPALLFLASFAVMAATLRGALRRRTARLA
jgi:predicted MFS family arabinose efflux permease